MSPLEKFLREEMKYDDTWVEYMLKQLGEILGQVDDNMLDQLIRKIIEQAKGDLFLSTAFGNSRDAGFSYMRSLPNRDTSIMKILFDAARELAK